MAGRPPSYPSAPDERRSVKTSYNNALAGSGGEMRLRRGHIRVLICQKVLLRVVLRPNSLVHDKDERLLREPGAPAQAIELGLKQVDWRTLSI
jgi:hypothetical protein